jgi:hypothetical protein
MRRGLFLIVTLAGLLIAGPALAQPAEPDPEKLRTFAELFRDPAIQSWLQAEAEGAPGARQAGTAGEAATVHQMMAGRVDAMHAFLRELAAAVPTLPGELGRAWRLLSAETQERGLLSVVLLLTVFAALGFGVEWLFWWATTGIRTRFIARRFETKRDRLRAVGRRASYGLGVLLASRHDSPHWRVAGHP